MATAADIPDGFVLEPPAPGGGRGAGMFRPVSDGRTAALSVFPDLQITQVERDPLSALGRANPNSWHNRSHAAVDARPIPGMTFDDYVNSYRSAGYHIIEAIDEVNHPSRHATGPHWHVVLGGGPEGGDAPADGPPIPEGWQVEQPSAAGPAPAAIPTRLNVPRPPLGAPSGVGTMAQAAAPPNPAFQDAASSLAPPPGPPGVGNGLTLNRAGITANERALTAGAPPPPTGYQDDPANVATQHQAPAGEVPTAQMTQRPDPRRAGLNDQVRAMMLNPGVSNDQLAGFLTSRGVDPSTINGWSAAMAWREAPASLGPQRSLAAWLQLPARQRGREGVQLDMENLPAGQYREVTRPENVPQAQATNWDPSWSERAGMAAHRLLAGDQRGSAVDQEIAGNVESGARFAGADVAQSAYQHAQAAQRAQLEGHPVTAAGHQLAAGAETAMILPVFRRAEEGAQLARPALAEIERLAEAHGVQSTGRAADDVIAQLATQHFGNLSPDTQDVLRSIIQPSPGEAAPDALTAAHISDLRSAANPPPTLLQRGVQAIRDRFGGGRTPEPAPPALPEAELGPRAPDRIDIPPSPGGAPQAAPTPTYTAPDLPAAADLWRLSPDQLDSALTLSRQTDRERLVAALGSEGAARRFQQLDRARNGTMDTARADAASRQFDAEFGDLSPAQERLIYGSVNDPEATPEDIQHLITAHSDVMPDDPHDWAAYMAATAARDTRPGDFEAVLNGRGTPQAQANYIRMQRAVQAMDRAGVPNIREQMIDAMVTRGGARPADASYLVDDFMNSFRGAAAITPRSIDRININSVAPPPGVALEDPLGRVQPLGEQPSPEAMADVARSVRPEDVLPIPGNRVETAEEAAAANPGTFRDVRAPDPATMLQMGSYRRQDGGTVRFRGPVDAESFLRLRGGLQDETGDLRAIGITNNAGRPEAPGEGRLGPILNRSSGLTLDQAGEALHEAGYFQDRPTRGEVVEMLTASRQGNRRWHDNDLGEVAGFEGAQAQQRQAEAAAQEGRPLADRIGSPVGPDDVAANEPPATAYEDLPGLGGKVGNVNLANIESTADIGRLLHNIEQKFGGFDAARRGVITHAETEALASELGMTADDLLRRRPGQALNAEQALAARQLLAKSSDEVIALAAKATGPEASDVSRAAFSEALLRHAAIHEQVTGATAEAGRALSAMRAAARSSAVSGPIHQAAIAGLGGQKRLEQVAEEIINLHRLGAGPGQVNSFAVRATQPRFRDKLIELWYNSLLSGPRTHAVNILSNLMTAGLQIPEHAAAAGLGAVRRGVGAALGHADDFDRVMGSEIGARTFGLMQGTAEGLRAFADTMRTGEVADHVTKVEARTQQAISGLKGSIIRAPTRALAAEDEFFKAIGRRMELNGLAVRQARSEGLSGQALADRIADLSANPTDAMIGKSMDYARYITFQRPLEPGSMAAGIQRWTQEHPWMKLFVPFVRTPANLLKFAVERSPAGVLLKSVRADLVAGGARRDLAVTRMMLGTGLALTVADLAHRGIITGGGPADRGALDLMRGDGWQPYSIRIGDTYYSYARMDPISTTLGVTADTVDFQQHMTPSQQQQAGPLLIASIIRNLGNKTWLSGISDLMNTINDSQRSLPNLVSHLGASIAVPAIVSQTAGVLDPTLRDTHAPTFENPLPDRFGLHYLGDPTLAMIQSRLPGVSTSLPARQDIWGHDVRREGALGPDIISPFSTSTAHNDPITAELLSIGARVGHSARQIAGVPLSPEQASSYAALSGRYIRDDLGAAMTEPTWQTMTPLERLRRIDSIKRDARADARADLGLDGRGGSASPALPSGFELAH